MRISYEHPKYIEIEDKARWLFRDRTDPIPLTLLERAYPDLFENVVYPECPDCESRDTECPTCHGENPGDSDEPLYPMWGTVFHINDAFLASWVRKNSWRLHEECSLYFFDDLEDFEGPLLFVVGAGYDFYESHWIPLFIASEMIDLEKYK
jgi:hypothetical protein